tara:strand:+ start:69106 stop:70179 length:1074 start_codon:yes stop_codon:yes gene_type:complete
MSQYQFNENCFRYNFNLEVLQGCRWKCTGCYVNKDENVSFSPAGLDKFEALSKSIADSVFIPSILIIGPTDIFTANNSLDLLNNKKFLNISKMYERLAFNTTFEAIDDELLNIINQKYGHLEVEFRIVIDLPLFESDFHLEKVRNNFLLAKDKLSNIDTIVIHPQLNLFNTSSEVLKEKLTDYLSINKRSYDFFDQGVDYAVSFGRREEISFNYQKKAFHLLKDCFEKLFTQNLNIKGVHFDAARLEDINENIFSYKNEKLYYAPKLYDEYVNFYDRYFVDLKKWHIDELRLFQDDLTISQYKISENLPCTDCDFLANCVNKGVVDFLDFMKMDECLFPRNAFQKYNPDKLYQELGQ